AEAPVGGLVVVVHDGRVGGEGGWSDFGFMGSDECPFGFVALEKGQRHGHLGVGECGAERRAEPTEGQVALGGEWSEDGSFRTKIKTSLLRWEKRRFHV